MGKRERDWSLKEYFQMFFPSFYTVTVIETEGEITQVSLCVANPRSRATACHNAPLSDFLDICCMAEIVNSLRHELDLPRMLRVIQ